MIIVYACSELYEKYCKLSIDSVLKYNPDVEIIIITKDKLDLPYNQIPPIRELSIKGLSDEYGYCGYAKLLLPEMLDFDKVIYLGADTICQGSLKELWEEPCEFINAVKTHNYGKIQANELGINHYINVDMMVMNLKELRKFDFAQTAIDNQPKIENSLSFWCNEESLINYTYHNKIKLLPQKYNYAYERNYDEPMPYDEATIIHFIGLNKEGMINYEKEKTKN